MIKWILASVGLCGLLLGGCAMSGPESESDSVAEPAVETQGAGIIRETIYYAEPALINQVGYCVFSSCPPKGTHCSGTKTAYKEIFEDPCF